MNFQAISLLLLAVGASAETATVSHAELVKGLLNRDEFKSSRRLDTETTTRRQNAPTFINQHRRFSLHNGHGPTTLEGRRNQDSKQSQCDAAFVQCLPNDKCASCFVALQTEGIDWASVTPETPCNDVIDFLFKGNHCTHLRGDTAATNTFCSTFNSCVVWDYSPSRGGSNLDCSKLTKCEWPGFEPAYLGDGVCQENIEGCYNTEICDFDGGDCCDDTCMVNYGAAGRTDYIPCGVDGYACRDPKSKSCDPQITKKCENLDPDSSKKVPDPEPPTCSSDETLYRLLQYDSFGDGWDETKLRLTALADGRVIYEDGLAWGSQGLAYVCLSSSPSCYRVQLSSGTWGNEISWEIKPMSEGAKAVADGGSPMNCTFPLNAEALPDCMRTCDGKPNVDPTLDPDYKSYKDLFTCIEKKCIIQVGACEDDPTCVPCFKQDAPEFCFANDNFNAVIDCGLCQCSDLENSEFCSTKVMPGTSVPPKAPDVQPSTPRPCSAAETLTGSAAVMTFAKCTEFDQVGMMITDFDQNNFGMLDDFEKCAHSFQKENSDGSRKALGCMQILKDAMTQETKPGSSEPVDAIKVLAALVYNNAEGFCECASKANKEAPLCPNFSHFKTLLYESLDACKSLDEIDCDAWNEFYGSCKEKIEVQFGKVNFKNMAECNFVKDGCDGAGPFPAFRRLDCGSEIPKNAWDFYLMYERDCLQADYGVAPVIQDKPTPQAPANAPYQTPNPTQAPTPGGETPSTPPPVMPTAPAVLTPPPTAQYVSPSDDVPPVSPGGEGGRKRHTMRNFFLIGIVLGGIYFYWKKRQDAFSFIRYRRQPRNFGSESEMMGGNSLYSGLSMEGSTGSTSFEPPTLPPPPSAVQSQQQFI